MKVKVAVVQENPIFFNKQASIDKVKTLCEECAKHGSQLVVFPESFIPGYPRGFSFGTTVGNRTDEGRALYAEYFNNSISLQSDDLKQLEEIANDNNIFLVMGITEQQKSNGTLYCSMLYISPSKGLLGVHRKIKPTGLERVIWGEADGDSLVTFNTSIGKMGGLICWENYMPLARMAMYRQGVELYIAPTADARDGWIASMQHIALEGRCFVLACNQYFTKSMYPTRFQHLVVADREVICRGGSAIVSPMGKIIAGPLYDQSGILYAQLDLEEIKMAKLDFDIVGHYARNDIFELKIKDQPEIADE